LKKATLRVLALAVLASILPGLGAGAGVPHRLTGGQVSECLIGCVLTGDTLLVLQPSLRSVA